MTESTTAAGVFLPGHSEQRAAHAPVVLRRVAFGVSYDGAEFHGFAAQPGVRTVAGAISAALGRAVGEAVVLTCAGRTDTGVHARCQVIHADLPAAALVRYEQLTARGRAANRREMAASGDEVVAGDLTSGDVVAGDEVAGDVAAGEPPLGPELPGLCRSLSQQLLPEISVWRAVVVPARFDARHAATFRRYRYDIETSTRLDPAFSHGAWHVGRPLDLPAMRLGTDPLIGEHDFAAFSRRVKGAPPGPIRRRVHDARWLVLDDGRLRFEIEARAFAHQMVRSIVGALVAVGLGRARPSDIVTLLRLGERQGAPRPAPARGLALVAVGYPEDLGGPWC